MLRMCLREPIPEIEIAAHRLDDAVSAHLRGDRQAADELLRLANDRIVWEWLDSVWGKESEYNRRRRVVSHPPALPKDQRAKPRDATPATKRLIHERDGFYCRFCKMPVIRSVIRDAVRREYPQAVPWGNTNATQHAAFQCMWAQYDHALPHARGGTSELSNVYLTCAACNFGRNDYLLEEQDLMHPSLIPPRTGSWDGLERFVDSQSSRTSQSGLVLASTSSPGTSSDPIQKLTVESEDYLHRYTWQVVRRHVLSTDRPRSGALYDDLVAMVFAFHSLEGYINFVGDRIAPEEWADERKRFPGGFREKLRRIWELCGLASHNDESRPLLTILELKKLRDAIAHPKTKKCTTTSELPLGEEPMRYHQSYLAEFVSADRAALAFEDVKQLADEINAAARRAFPDKGIQANAFEGIQGMATATIKVDATGQRPLATDMTG